MNEFEMFLNGLRSDERLGKFLPPPTPNTSAATVVLQLCLSLAAAYERETIHPAFKTLEELDNPAPLPLRPPLALRGRVGLVMGKVRSLLRRGPL